MRIGLVAPPFISVPPAAYGGTELFVAHLAHGLRSRGHDVVVYANGDSRVSGARWRYPHAQWPLENPLAAQLKNADHTAWAIHEAARAVDVLHLNDIVGLPFTMFVGLPAVLTLHHPHEPTLSEMYLRYPDVQYVAISRAQARREPMPGTAVVHHGLVMADYTFRSAKRDYLAFLGRMVPCKGAHLAIEVARRSGLPLKLAGEIQPMFSDYWEREVRPHVDGRRVEYVGPADHALKNDLLAHARALLFPIQWEEPFGLVMIEAMACGTPVLALPGGSVPEVVRDGTSGWICRDVAEMADRAAAPGVTAASCREWATEQFACERMVERYLEVYEETIDRTAGLDEVLAPLPVRSPIAP